MAESDTVISIDIGGWQTKIAEYMVATGKGMREALYEEWPLLMRKVMDFTPPFQTKGAKGATDQSVGRAAVARDIRKTMRPFDPASIRTKGMAEIVRRKDITAFNVVASRVKTGPMVGARAIAFSPAVHTSARNRRGRVGKNIGDVVLGTDAALLKKYVAKIQGRVGFAKSGWLKALQLVGGDAPGYVTKQGTGGGDVIDDHANEDNPSITAINRTPWSVRKDEGERILTDAYASRTVAIHAKILTKLRLAREQAKLAAA